MLEFIIVLTLMIPIFFASIELTRYLFFKAILKLIIFYVLQNTSQKAISISDNIDTLKYFCSTYETKHCIPCENLWTDHCYGSHRFHEYLKKQIYQIFQYFPLFEVYLLTSLQRISWVVHSSINSQSPGDGIHLKISAVMPLFISSLYQECHPLKGRDCFGRFEKITSFEGLKIHLEDHYPWQKSLEIYKEGLKIPYLLKGLDLNIPFQKEQNFNLKNKTSRQHILDVFMPYRHYL